MPKRARTHARARKAAAPPHRRGAPATERASSEEQPLAALQRSAGNAAVTQLVQRQEADGAPARPTIRSGSQGPDVVDAKTRLNMAGADPQLPLHEVFDETMRKATVDFQRDHALGPDGVIGKATWGLLDRLAGGRIASSGELDAAFAQQSTASLLLRGGDFVTAKALLTPLYGDMRITTDARAGITFDLAWAEHGLGNFDEAVSLYEECSRLMRTVPKKRDCEQRIREARQQLPPGAIEHEVSEANLPEGTQAPPSTDRPIVKVGSTGDDVIDAKLRLNLAGADPQLAATPTFDDQARQATIAFQRDHALTPDGVVGALTWGALDQLAGGRLVTAQELNEAFAQRDSASALLRAGDFVGAGALLLPLYRNLKLPPEQLSGITFDLAWSEHGQGNFDKAVSLYEEALPLFKSIERRRDTEQRIREARTKLPPGPIEHEVSEANLPEGTSGTPSTTRPLIKLGSTGPDVVDAKLRLNLAGTDPSLPATPTFDDATRQATIAFQKNHGLDPDGIIGPLTWGALDTLAGDRLLSADELEAAFAQRDSASKLLRAGDFVGAGALLLPLYRNSKLPPEQLSGITFDLAWSEHGRGNFDEAISLYQEAHDLFKSEERRRDSQQRMREARLRLPPGAIEHEVTEANLAAAPAPPAVPLGV